MRTLLNRYLDTDGDGSGTKNARGTYLAATDFFLAPGTEESFVVESLTIKIEATGALSAADYGTLPALAPTGIGLYHDKGPAAGGLIDLLDGITITRHYEWLTLPHKAPHVDTTPLGGVTTNFFLAEICFREPLILVGKYAQALRVRLPAEDFSGLDGHYFLARGTVGGSV